MTTPNPITPEIILQLLSSIPSSNEVAATMAKTSAAFSGLDAPTQGLVQFKFSQFSASNPLPSTLSGFLALFGQQTNQDAIQTALLADYQQLNNMSTDWGSSGLPNPSQSNFNSTVLVPQFTAWFQNLLKNYPYNGSNPIGNFSNFLTTTAQQLTIVAGLGTKTILTNYDSSGNVVPIPTSQQALIERYQQIYDAFFPDKGFQARLLTFYQQQVSDQGFFIPSQAVAQWTSDIVSEYAASKTIPIDGSDNSSLSSANFDKTLILNRIFALLAKIIGTMQSVASVQANRLLVLTQWQQAYTNTESQLRTFLKGDGTRLGADDATDQRNNVNNNLNVQWRSNLENNRSVLSDDAKSLQSNINQSTDAVSQQSNLATAVIQELTTILGSIYR